MSKSLECNIVRNILPNYIDKLTDKDINKYIKKHLSTCAECRQIYEDMSGELDIEKQHRERNKRQIRRFNNKILRLVAIICSIIIIITIGIVIYENYMAKEKEQGYTFITGNYVKEDKKNSKDGYIYCTIVAVFDKNEICVSARIVEDGYTEEYLEKNIKNALDKDILTNSQIINNSKHYNMNIWNGWNKADVEKFWYEHYIKETIESI